jgi:hypothetical protein
MTLPSGRLQLCTTIAVFGLIAVGAAFGEDKKPAISPREMAIFLFLWPS